MYVKKILTTENIDHKMCGEAPMFVVGRELHLLRVEVLHFRRV